ncbi:MAG: LLM class F420-dependent oxidoreductase, partial [Dehalococcoidia bacterium]
MAVSSRWGLTLPLPGIPLAQHREVLQEAERLGYTDAWSQDTDQGDPFTPLAVAAASTRQMRLGTMIANTFTHGPAVLAMSALSLAEAAPGRFCLGLGSSSPVIVQDWNGIPFGKPLTRTKDVFLLVREALDGGRVNRILETARMQSFRLGRPLPAPVPMYLAAMRPGMLHLAGQMADGVLINWLGAADVPKVVATLREAALEAGRDPGAVEVVCRVFVAMHDDRELAYTAARRAIALYLNTPAYRAFHRWLGNEQLYGEMWQRWDAGDRRGAVLALSEEAVDYLIGIGDADRCHAFVAAYRASGVDTPVLAFA